MFVAGAGLRVADRIPLSPWIVLAALAAGVALLGTRAEVYALYGAIVYGTLVLAY